MKDINTLKRDYMNELSELRRLRNEFEDKIKEVRATKEKFEAELKEVTKVNDVQERRIKILELQEKVASLITATNYLRALEYAAVGLELDPKNTILLNQKASALWKSRNYHQALTTYKQLLDNDPNDFGTALNAMEIALIAGAITDFKTLSVTHKDVLAKIYDGELKGYFEALESYQSGAIRLAIEQVCKFLSSQTEKKKRAGTWSFSDAHGFFNSKPASPDRDAFIEYLRVLEGSESPEVALGKIRKLVPSAAT